MTGKQHMAIGFGLTVAFFNPTLTLSAVIGSLLPDIDSRESMISSVLPIQKMTGCAFMTHRGGVHSIFASVVVGIVVYYTFGLVAAIGVFVGYMSHLLADMLTFRGVRLLFPKKKRYRFLKHDIRGLTIFQCNAVAGLIFMFGFLIAVKRLGWI